MRKEYDFSGARRGAIELPDPRKTRITIRLDTKILKWFWQRVDEAGGGNYQTMINEVLKNYIESENKKIRRYPGGLQGEREVRYQMEGEGEGSELKGRGYDLKENIREYDALGKKRPSGSIAKKKITATKTVKYNRKGISKLPDDQPVLYRIVDESGRMNYVGVAQKGYVRERISGHLDKVPGVKVQIEQFANMEDAMKKEVNVIRRAKARYGRGKE